MLVFIATFLPTYSIERATETFYFTPHFAGIYFLFSGLRLYVSIIYLGAMSFAFGRFSRSIRATWVAYSAGLIFLYLLLYGLGCIPKVCYITGIDGLEPLRPFSFFLAEGLGLSYIGYPSSEPLSRSEILVSKIASFYAVAYYPVIFTIAGAKLVGQLSPVPVLLVVALLSFAVSVNASERLSSWRLGLIIPLLSFFLLSAVSLGIAVQYISQAIALVAMICLVVIAASVVGILASYENDSAVRRFVKSKPLAIGVVGLVLIINVVITPDAVVGTAPNSKLSYYFLDPVFAGAFMSFHSISTEGVSANFSFQGTNASAIQPNNFLALGIGIHTPNCCVDGIDYGYRSDVFLYHNSSEVFAASAWEVCDVILACGGHSWKDLIFFYSERISLSLNNSFALSIVWVGGSAEWNLTYGHSTRLVATFAAPEQENHGFDAGYLGSSSPPTVGGVPFYQFGLMSAYPINHAGWSATVSCPAILENSTWQCVSHVELLQGDQSYWKALWRWGESYPNVGATVNQQGRQITFQYSSTNAIADYDPAW